MENEMQKQQSTAIATPQGRGFEEPTDKEDLLIPRAKLYQGLPVEQEQYPDGKPGQVLNSVTKEVLPDLFIPIFKFTRYVKFNPREKNSPFFDANVGLGDVCWESTDPYDPRVVDGIKFGPNGEAPEVTKILNFFCQFQGVPMPIVISFSKTSMKAGKQLMTIAQFSGGDLFSKKYKLGVQKQENEKGSYWVLTISPAGIPTNEEYAECARLWENFHMKPIEVHKDEVKKDEVPF